MKKVIQESVDRVEEGLDSLLEGYVSKLEDVFNLDLQEARKKAKEEEEEECDDEDVESKTDDVECKDSDDSKKKDKVEENVIKNKGDKTEVTFRKGTPDKEKVSKFSKDGNATDGDSGYDEEKPSAETPDKKAGDNKEKDNETVPGKEGNSGKTVKEGYSEFKKDNPQLDSTEFTKDKKGTDSKTPGFDEEDASEKTYDDDVEYGATEELAKDGKDDNANAGFKEKDKPAGTALAAKKKKFPSKNPKVQGTPGTVKD